MKIRKRHLWWLLLPVVAGCLLAGIQIAAAYRQQAAVRAIEKLGGRIVTTHGEPGWMRGLTGGKSLGIFEDATVVNLSHSNVKDDDLLHLQRLNGLQRLNLHGTAITDQGLTHLGALTELKALDLSGTEVTGAGLAHLQGLVDLEYLYLTETRIADADLGALKGLEKLRHLDVSETAVSDDGAGELRHELPDLHVRW